MAETNTSSYKAWEDRYGNFSSKRICGFVLLFISSVMAVTLFYFSIIRPIGDSVTALSIIKYFLTGGSSLLGIGVFEGLTIMSKNKTSEPEV